MEPLQQILSPTPLNRSSSFSGPEESKKETYPLSVSLAFDSLENCYEAIRKDPNAYIKNYFLLETVTLYQTKTAEEALYKEKTLRLCNFLLAGKKQWKNQDKIVSWGELFSLLHNFGDSLQGLYRIKSLGEDLLEDSYLNSAIEAFKNIGPLENRLKSLIVLCASTEYAFDKTKLKDPKILDQTFWTFCKKIITQDLELFEFVLNKLSSENSLNELFITPYRDFLFPEEIGSLFSLLNAHSSFNDHNTSLKILHTLIRQDSFSPSFLKKNIRLVGGQSAIESLVLFLNENKIPLLSQCIQEKEIPFLDRLLSFFEVFQIELLESKISPDEPFTPSEEFIQMHSLIIQWGDLAQYQWLETIPRFSEFKITPNILLEEMLQAATWQNCSILNHLIHQFPQELPEPFLDQLEQVANQNNAQKILDLLYLTRLRLNPKKLNQLLQNEDIEEFKNFVLGASRSSLVEFFDLVPLEHSFYEALVRHLSDNLTAFFSQESAASLSTLFSKPYLRWHLGKLFPLDFLRDIFSSTYRGLENDEDAISNIFFTLPETPDEYFSLEQIIQKIIFFTQNLEDELFISALTEFLDEQPWLAVAFAARQRELELSFFCFISYMPRHLQNVIKASLPYSTYLYGLIYSRENILEQYQIIAQLPESVQKSLTPKLLVNQIGKLQVTASMLNLNYRRKEKQLSEKKISEIKEAIEAQEAIRYELERHKTFLESAEADFLSEKIRTIFLRDISEASTFDSIAFPSNQI